MKSAAALRNLALAALASLGLSGCYYGDVYGTSYAGADCYARYGDQYWVNDPYADDDATYGYDCYDASDYRAGFVQIGFGGGWHQQLYYPGHGLFLFDRYGRRHAMSHDHLTYWGGRRAWWKHHGHRYRGHDQFRPRGESHDGPYEGRRPGRGYNGGNWRNDAGTTAAPPARPQGERPRRNWREAPPAAAPNAVPVPDAGTAPGVADRPRRTWRANPGVNPAPAGVPNPDPRQRRSWDAAPPPGPAATPQAAPIPEARPPRAERPDRPRSEGARRAWSPPTVIDAPQRAPSSSGSDQPHISMPPGSANDLP